MWCRPFGVIDPSREGVAVRWFGPIAIAAAIAARVALGLVSICTPTGPRADDVPLDGRWAVLCPAVPRGPRACHRAV